MSAAPVGPDKQFSRKAELLRHDVTNLLIVLTFFHPSNKLEWKQCFKEILHG